MLRKLISGMAMLLCLLVWFGCGANNMANSLQPQMQHFSMASGNWSFGASSSTNPNSGQFLVGGHLQQSGNSVTGILHIASSRCFKVDKDVPVSGTVEDGALNLTSLPVDHQILHASLTGRDTSLVGNYSFTGGCSNADEGSLTGNLVPSVSGMWNATETQANKSVAGVNMALAQSANPNGHGVYPISGTMAFTGSTCQVSGRITSGYVAGNIVILNAETQESMGSHGSMRLEGDFSSGKAPAIVGAYTYGSGACKDQAGVLTFTP